MRTTQTPSNSLITHSSRALLLLLALVITGCNPTPKTPPPVDPNIYGTKMPLGDMQVAVERTMLLRTDEMIEAAVMVRVYNPTAELYTVKPELFKLVNAKGDEMPVHFKPFNTEYKVVAGGDDPANLHYRVTEEDLNGALYLVAGENRLMVKEDLTLPENRMPIYNGDRTFISPYWSKPESVLLPKF